MAKKHSDNSRESELSIFIDRIEEDIAVLMRPEKDEVFLKLPLAALPADVKEGDWLTLTFAIDDENTNAASQRVAALQAELTQDNDPEQMNFKL